jgi:hypothetical protein
VLERSGDVNPVNMKSRDSEIRTTSELSLINKIGRIHNICQEKNQLLNVRNTRSGTENADSYSFFSLNTNQVEQMEAATGIHSLETKLVKSGRVPRTRWFVSWKFWKNPLNRYVRSSVLVTKGIYAIATNSSETRNVKSMLLISDTPNPFSFIQSASRGGTSSIGTYFIRPPTVRARKERENFFSLAKRYESNTKYPTTTSGCKSVMEFMVTRGNTKKTKPAILSHLVYKTRAVRIRNTKKIPF